MSRRGVTHASTNPYRAILRALSTHRVAQIDPHHLAALWSAAQNTEGVVPIGDGAEADEPNTQAGILVYPVRGSIVHHWTDGFATWGLVTPTEWLIEQLDAAAADDTVGGVLLDIDSGGGMAVGTPEAADAIFRFRETKPIWAIANGDAYSAAYYLGAAASRFLVTPSGGVGSIGTLVIHQDLTGMLQQLGVKIEILRATDAENKARFNPFEPLDQNERVAVQAELDARNDRFLADVARFREMDAGSVAEVSQMGRTFLADDAVARGLADGVMAIEQAVAELSAEVSGAETRAMGRVATGTETRNLTPDMGTEVRAEEGGHRMVGAGLNFGVLSADMGGWREVFEDGAFEMSDDPKVVWQHDPSCVLGREKAGTAHIWCDERAMRYWADPPDTTWARDAMESVRRGDVDQNSFRFRVLPGGQRWERRNGEDVRVISKARLYEVGPQTNPAYPDTSVAVGELRAWRASDEYAAAVAADAGRSREVYERRSRLRGMTL